MTLVDPLCAHKDPVVAYRARRLLAGESDQSPAMRGLRRSIGTTKIAQRLLMGLRTERFNPYRKWQGPHWTLYSLAEIGYPTGDKAPLPLRERVLDWMFAPAFLKPPRTAIYHDQPERPRRCASMEGNTIWSQLILGIVDEKRVPLLWDEHLALPRPSRSAAANRVVVLSANGLWPAE